MDTLDGDRNEKVKAKEAGSRSGLSLIFSPALTPNSILLPSLSLSEESLRRSLDFNGTGNLE